MIGRAILTLWDWTKSMGRMLKCIFLGIICSDVKGVGEAQLVVDGRERILEAWCA